MNRLFLLAPIIAAVFISCQQTPLPTNTPSSNLELSIDSTGGSKGRSVTARVLNRGAQNRGILRDADVTFTALSTTTQNDGAYDYVQTQFQITNNSATSFNNLTLYAVAKSGNVGNTAIKTITDFGGTVVADQARVAKLVTPLHGVNVGTGGLSLIDSRTDFQAFEPSEVSALQNDPAWTTQGFSSSDKVLGYGFVARVCVPDCTSLVGYYRSIGPFDTRGFITISLRIPRTTGAAYKFVMNFAVVNETESRVTRSVYPSETLSAAEQRLTDLLSLSATPEVMQIGLTRGASPSSTRANKGADVVEVSSDASNGNASYTALGLGRITAGGNHSCGLTASGAAYCWGYNGLGQLGNNSSTNSSLPVAVAAPSGGSPLSFSSITAGSYHSCGVTTNGAAYCWGLNFYGQLGNNSTANSSLPTRDATLSFTL